MFQALIVREIDPDHMLFGLVYGNHCAKNRRDHAYCDPQAKAVGGFLSVAERGGLFWGELDDLPVVQGEPDFGSPPVCFGFPPD